MDMVVMLIWTVVAGSGPGSSNTNSAITMTQTTTMVPYTACLAVKKMSGRDSKDVAVPANKAAHVTVECVPIKK